MSVVQQLDIRIRELFLCSFSRLRWAEVQGVKISGVRGGSGRLPPRLEKFRANSVFRVSSSCSKILEDEKYFNTVKNIRANSVFQGKRRLFKILNDKKIYIQYS